MVGRVFGLVAEAFLESSECCFGVLSGYHNCRVFCKGGFGWLQGCFASC